MKKAEPKTPRAKAAPAEPKEPKAKKPAAPRRPRKSAAAKEAAPVSDDLFNLTAEVAPAPTPAVTARSITFSIASTPGLPVYVAGTFNNWDPESIPLVEKDGVYSVTLTLEPGEYEYKFIVNGFWTMDPDPSREWRANGLGTLNSVVKVD